MTKLCNKDGVVKDGVSKMVCKRLCVKDAGVSKMVCERWCVTTWCVKDGV